MVCYNWTILFQIASIYHNGGYTFIEMVPIISTAGNAVQTEVDFRLFNKIQRVQNHHKSGAIEGSFTRVLNNEVSKTFYLGNHTALQ